MIVLRDGGALARVDESHGAEVLDLVDLRTGRQLLGRPPFGSLPPLAGDLDEMTWSKRWRGGWQTCFPNFGTECEVAGTRHGFHGSASNDPWEVVEHDEASVELSWEGHGLRAGKRIAVDSAAGGCELRLEVELEAVDAEVPAIALEHLALGLELIEPEVRIELPAGRASELDADLGPVEPPADAPPWPEIGLLDGGREQGDGWRLADPRSRLFIVREVPEGRATIRNATRGQTVEIEWDHARLPQVAVWHEARTSDGLWRGQTEVLCIEPCSVPHLRGLATAVESGRAWELRPGEPVSWWMTMRSEL